MLATKKGQVALYVIIAIVVLAILLAVYFIVQTYKESEKKRMLAEVEEVKQFVYDCIRDVGYDALLLIGKKGGYLYLPKNRTEIQVAIYLEGNETRIPSKELIEQGISDYVNEELFFCTKNFTNFSNLKIQQGGINTKAKIEEDRIILDVDYPLQIISKQNEVYFLRQFNDIEINVRLEQIYNASRQIIEEQAKTPEHICFSCAFNIANKNNLSIEIVNFDKKLFVYSLMDLGNPIKGNPYEFTFGIIIK
jgi:uncharacterized protein YpmB